MKLTTLSSSDAGVIEERIVKGLVHTSMCRVGFKHCLAVRTSTHQSEILLKVLERSAEEWERGGGGGGALTERPNPSTEHPIHSRDRIICKFEID